MGKKLKTRLFITALIIFSGLIFPFQSYSEPGKIKNIIILIGDGMGFQQLGLLNSYAKYAPDSIYKDRKRITAVEQVMQAGVIGCVYHEAANVLVTDSAASGTQIASGKWAGSEMIGIDEHGSPAETILEKAKKMGKAAGLVSDTRVTHATPAAFAAHQPRRTKENEIAQDILNNEVDIILGGGLGYWIPEQANDKESEIYKILTQKTLGQVYIKSKRKDNLNLIDEAVQKGYVPVFTREQMNKACGDKILGLFSYSGMPDGIVQTLNNDNPERSFPNLREMTIKAIEILEKNDNGFFLMVEAGQVDWACHNNDTGTLLHELLQFDTTLDYIFQWVKNRNDTLLIVTADHETGGFGFSYSRMNIPQPQDFPGNNFPGEKFAPSFNFGTHNILDRIYNQKLSYFGIMREFDSLPKPEQTAKMMADIVNKYTDFPIKEDEAAQILEIERNKYYIQGHDVLGAEIFPKINDFKEFYVYGREIRTGILGRVAGKYQNTVWSTGTHTNAPVPLVVYGPEEISSRFSKMLHTTELGKLAADAFIRQ
ncbi:Alkaline phosphatase 3 [Desulfonema limicola]|uniref:Alkaline phosphatase 3 n=1 Tax=Desulfonema limicola TaxID=45656 RepID=A0A975GF67_9BACT|nr:alkaline phosphatase [Desulfonema limicola]QTA78928.1 Alkaline phosphatase 3 [Desulfonema limicola]